MNEVYVVDILRTPIGKFGGTLANERPDDLAAHVIKALINRNQQVDWNKIDEVILGAANQAGEDNRNVARMSLLLAGLSEHIPGYTVNRLCASGLQSMQNAFMAIRSGQAEAIIAGGTESMTRAPFVMAKSEKAYSRVPEIYDTTIGWRFTNSKLSELYHPYSMGETAENVAEKYNISRDRQDQFAYKSQLKWSQAQERGDFQDEIIHVTIPQRKKDDIVFDTDEHPRLSTIDVLQGLKPAFKKDGTVTAGNSSGINDGAAACLIVSEAFLKEHSLTPIAKIKSISVAGVDPAYMGIGPVPATQKALKNSQIEIGDIDVFELNEAFAAQAVACMDELAIDPSKVNKNGGSIAIGHPLGASGTRISATLLHQMKKNPNLKLGLATMCVGVGQGSAILFENAQ